MLSVMATNSLVSNWLQVLQTQNLEEGRRVDLLSRWLLIVRASVFPMTLFSACVGGLLAARGGNADWGLLALATFGLLVAHAANNMINDYFDTDSGVDTEGYVRTLYAPHPIFSGLISKRGLIAAIALANAVDLLILIYFVELRGPMVAWFAMGGLFISVFYVAPPLRLKHHVLGEPGVFIVWGPLMVGGTCYVATGAAPADVLLASLPYALLVTSVLFGKHIDKIEADSAKGIRTLPVILGPTRALLWAKAMMVVFYLATGALVLAGLLTPWALLVLAGLPMLRETLATFSEPPPDEAPEGFPLWPLWYVAWAFRHTRRAGGLFVLALVLDLLVPLSLPF